MHCKQFLPVIILLIIHTALNINNAADFNNRSLYYSDVNVIIENDSLLQKEYNRIIREALGYQLIADSLGRLAKKKRSLLQETKDPRERIEIINDISRLEQESDKYQEMADKKYNNSFIYVVHDSKSDTAEEKIRLVSEINGIKVYRYVPAGFRHTIKDSALSSVIREKLLNQSVQSGKDKADEFEILEISPYNDLNPIPSEVIIPAGLVFRIQLGVFSQPVQNNTFRGLSPLSYISVKGKAKYYAGIFYSSKSANEALKKIREYGFPDAFIVAFHNRQQIPIEKAKEIEYSQIKL